MYGWIDGRLDRRMEVWKLKWTAGGMDEKSDRENTYLSERQIVWCDAEWLND